MSWVIFIIGLKVMFMITFRNFTVIPKVVFRAGVSACGPLEEFVRPFIVFPILTTALGKRNNFDLFY